MDEWLYVMIIEKNKSYNKVTKAVIERHVENLRKLDDNGKLVLCGPLKNYPGVAGMVILRAQNIEEADELCKLEPLVLEGYAKYKLKPLQVANKDNNYLL
ncbi:MAG: YciI family protein [Coprobacillaceae bacterium]